VIRARDVTSDDHLYDDVWTGSAERNQMNLAEPGGSRSSA
jgi:hypothetical protein